jgi:Ca2+-binding EF-hand superfamily protein
MDFSTPEGTPPSDEELNFIIKIADRSGDGCMDRPELQTALIVWKTFTKRREQLEETLKKYDKSGTGKLEKPELKAYLTELNDGKEPSDAEVDWVLSEADFMGDGAIHTTELVMATQSWYSYGEYHPEAAPAASSTETSAKEPSASACCSIS